MIREGCKYISKCIITGVGEGNDICWHKKSDSVRSLKSTWGYIRELK